MNILIIPFHDWRKIILEGFRTRDAHFIEELKKRKEFNIKIVINRPTTFLEIVLKRKKNLIKGEVVFAKSNFKLYKLEKNFYVIDYVSNDIFGQIRQGYKWFINQYVNAKYLLFINDCINILGIKNNYTLLNQNIFAYKLSESLTPALSVFDAWDNFLKFNVYNDIIKEIEIGYKSYSKNTNFWITNSNDNIIDFTEKFDIKHIHLIKNGVDVTRFVESKKNVFPEDMEGIKRPIIGFGGKITHLINVDLLNETMKLSADVSFVFVGQILDKNIFNQIEKVNNFYYLGDKHYDDYPNYVKNFDICIVPYVVSKEKKSGANSIKVYEYLATGKKVIGTASNGLEDLQDYLFVVNTSKEFSKAIKDVDIKKAIINVEEHSWNTKVKDFIALLNEYKTDYIR